MKDKPFLSGLIVGSSMLVPGVSGGTMAIILGIYDKLIHAVSAITDNFRENVRLLLKFALGAGLGILLLSKGVLVLFESYETPMRFLFSGIVLGSVPALFRRSGVKSLDGKSIFEMSVCILSGLGICVLLTLAPTGLISFDGSFSLVNTLIISLSGIIIAVALVLPGISASHMLLILGVYETTLEAVHTLRLSVLIPLVLSVGAGTLLSASAIERALNSFQKQSYLCIIGFVIASSREIMPKSAPQGITLVISLVLLAMGITLAGIISNSKKIKA